MMPWTTQEISLLIGLWPNASAAQISKRLNRSRGSVCGKAMRLRGDGVLPAEVEKHFEVNPALQMWPAPRQGNATSIRPVKPTPPVDATCRRRKCGVARCLNSTTVNAAGRSAMLAQVATLFCGGAVEPGRAYCGHHWRMACG